MICTSAFDSFCKLPSCGLEDNHRKLARLKVNETSATFLKESLFLAMVDILKDLQFVESCLEFFAFSQQVI